MGRNRKQITLEKIHLARAGAKGVSIGKTEEGKVVLVKGAIPGDVVDVLVYKKKKAYLEGKAIHFHQYSTDRVDPKCKHFGVCGGCKWQNMDYEAQLGHKQSEVEGNLRKYGRLTDFETIPIKSSDEIYYYRNKMEFSFSNASWLTQEEVDSGVDLPNRDALGFHIPGMWSKILDLDECHLQAEPSNTIRQKVNAYAKEKGLEYYNLREQEGFLRTLMIRTSSTGEVMVLFQLFREEKETQEQLFEYLLQEVPSITTLLFAINSKGNDSIYDLDIETYSGPGFIEEEMEGLRFKIGPKSFYQTNSAQAYELYKLIRDFADLKGDELVYDLYTGTGTIAQFISKQAKKVIGIESVPEAIEAAKSNAEKNGIENCTFYCGDMKEVLNEAFVQVNGRPEVVITDPPRDGMHKKVVENILKMNPKRIVYVSCNSATQARDLDLMREAYTLVKIQAVDMFPQTHHVENIALLERKS